VQLQKLFAGFSKPGPRRLNRPLLYTLDLIGVDLSTKQARRRPEGNRFLGKLFKKAYDTIPVL